MPLYPARFKYCAEAIKAMMEAPEDRGAIAAEAGVDRGEKLGMSDTWGGYAEATR